MSSEQTTYLLLTIREKALLYLKVRAVCRGKLIKQFVDNNQLTLESAKLNDQFSELYALLEKNPKGMDMLNEFLISVLIKNNIKAYQILFLS